MWWLSAKTSQLRTVNNATNTTDGGRHHNAGCAIESTPGSCGAVVRSPRITSTFRANPLDMQLEVLRLLDEILNLEGRSMSFNSATPLLGAVPELDSMAVVALITTLEDRFGVAVADDEISGETFATVGSLTDFIAAKLG